MVHSVVHRFLLAMLCAPGLACAAAWIDFEGAIPGESTATGHQDWIDISSFELEGMLDEVGGFTFNKNVDKASPALMLACARGNRFAKATLDLDRYNPRGDEPRLVRLVLENVLIDSQQTRQSTDGAGEEYIGIKFVKITYTYYMPDSNYVAFDFDNHTKKGGITEGGPDADTDNDDMPDSWEEANGLNVGVNDADGDLDGDGLSNIDEFRLGTNPQSGSSFFKATLAPDPASPGNFLLTWNSVNGKTYVVDWSPDLMTPFSLLQTKAATGTTTSVNIGAAGAKGFYRVSLQTTP